MNNRRPLSLVSLLLSLAVLHAADTVPDKSAIFIPPPQDQGLPYTRSAQPFALAKIKGSITVCAGSRYAYVDGLRTRLEEKDPLHGGEARLEEGELYVPADFAPVLDLKNPRSVADQPLYNLADRWVHTLRLPNGDSTRKSDRDFDGKPYVNLVKLAKQKGLKVSSPGRGLFLIGNQDVAFSDSEKNLLDCVITLFDTPDRFADPSIAPSIIPTLKRQGVWTDHVKVSKEDLTLLNGPETKWETAPASSYDTNKSGDF